MLDRVAGVPDISLLRSEINVLLVEAINIRLLRSYAVRGFDIGLPYLATA